MRIFPEKYDELDIDKYDKQLVSIIKRLYRDNKVATFMLCCNPTKTPDGIVNVLITECGVVCFKMIDDIEESDLIPRLFERQILQKQEESIIIERIKMQKSLVSNGSPIFPIRVISLFSNSTRPDPLPDVALESFNDFVSQYCLFNDFFTKAVKNQSLIDSILCSQMRPIISEEILPDVVNRLTPEYTIPQKKAAIDSEKTRKKVSKLVDQDISEADKASLAYLLDESQINYINKIKKGDQLIIACAGSGKSVILLSKCFKVASLNPDKEFLVTGYNRNLMSYFRWLIDSAGFSSRNVRCMTFHKLAIDLLNRSNIPVPQIINNDYSPVVERLRASIESGRIKDSYYGIFIDEVQMFEPSWYRICYQLLDNKSSDEHIFVICGDKSQSVKRSIKSGKAPWQGHGEGYPNFRGKSFPIEINYRNSIPINNYIRRFTDYALRYSEMCKINMNQDSDIFLRGRAIRDGIEPEVLRVKIHTSEAEAIAVINQIIDIHDNYKIPYDSIAVIYYNKSYKFMKNWGERDYEPIARLIELLKAANIPHSMLVNTQDNYAVSYSDISGVPIVSMESSLGLDFRAVILCGLRPLGYYDRTKDLSVLTANKSAPNVEIEDAYGKNINIVYMACARAKEVLRIVLTEDGNESFYSKLLIKSLEEL